jgi:hypothetical protein
LTPRGSTLLFGCGCDPGCSQRDLAFDLPYTKRKAKSSFSQDEIDIPIYNWREATFVGLESKNLRKRIGSKK